MPSDPPLIRARRKAENSPRGWDSLIDVPRKPTAYANQRMLRIQVGEFPDYQGNPGIRLELMTTDLAKP